MSITEPLRRHDPLGDEIALPERSCMDLDEFVPGAVSSLRAGIVPVLLENVLDRVPGNGADVQLPQLAENTGVTPVVGLRQLEDQLADLLAGSTATDLATGAFRRLAVLTNPTAQRTRVDDRDKLVESAAQLRAQPDQPAPLGRLHEHARRQAATENLVLRLEVGHVASEFLLRRSSQNQQKRSLDVPHTQNPGNLASDLGLAPFLHTSRPVFRQEYAASLTGDGVGPSSFRERSRAL